MNKIVRLAVVFSIFFLLNHSFDLFAQKIKSENVPDDVKQTLIDQQGEVKVSQWTMNEDVYIASFKVDGASVMAYIQSDGTFIKAATIVPKSTLPSAILTYIERNYPEFAVPISEIREEANVPLYYYIEVKPDVVGASTSVLTFDNAGKLLSRKDPEGFETPEMTPQQLVQQKAEQEIADSNAPKGKNKQTPKTVKQTPKTEKQTPASEPKQQPSTPKSEPKPKAEPTPKSTPKQKAEPQEEPQEGDVPSVVQKAFAKKVMQPENLTWNTIDVYYVADCIVKEQKNELYFTKAGVWEKTYTYLPEEAITGAMLKHLTTNYKGFEFITAIKETRADKQDKVLVEFIEKANQKAQVSTSIVFDKLGRILKTYNANEEQPSDIYEKLSVNVINENPQDIPELAIASFKQKYPKITGVEWSENDEGYYLASYYGVRGKEVVVLEGNGSMIEIRTEANRDNISSNIESYIKKNHKGCQISEYYSVRGLIEKKNYYLVVVKDKKTNMTTQLKFSLAGQIMQ